MRSEMRTVMTAITVATFFLSGCLTPKVWNKGLHTRTVDGERVYKAQDQSLAVEARIIGLKGSYTRYFVNDGKLLEAGLRTNPPYTKHSDQIIYIDVSGAQKSSWQEYPSETVARDATPTDLPVKFSSNASTYTFNDSITVNVAGETKQVKLGGFYGLKKDRDPKSYPQLALLLPAAVVDVVIGIVMAPVVIFCFIYEGIAGHNGRPARDKQ